MGDSGALSAVQHLLGEVQQLMDSGLATAGTSLLMSISSVEQQGLDSRNLVSHSVIS